MRHQSLCERKWELVLSYNSPARIPRRSIGLSLRLTWPQEISDSKQTLSDAPEVKKKHAHVERLQGLRRPPGQLDGHVHPGPSKMVRYQVMANA